MNSKEQVFLNSCELTLQQFSSKLKGSVYFIWRKGKKHTQSLKYPCSEDITPMKQTLSLSLKTYVINGQMKKRYTHLSVFDANGKELDRVDFDVTEWKGQQVQKKLVLGQCNLRIKVRRRVALQLQNFHRQSKAQLQQSSQQSAHQQAVDSVKLQKKQQLAIKQQLAKSRRQLQDYQFLTNKLKSDRNFYITENETLRNKLTIIHQEYSQQISVMKEHYETRLQIKESIYQQEIQQLISTFNQNYEINRALIQGLVHQKYDYQAEINSMKQMHQAYITKQQDSYQQVISQLQHNKKQTQDQIRDLLTKITLKQTTITKLQKDLQETKILFDETKDQLNKEIQHHAMDNQKWEKELEEKQLTLYKKNQQIEAMHVQIDTKDFQMKENQAALEHYRILIAQFERSIVEKEKMNHEIQAQRYNLTVQIQHLKVTVQQQTSQIQFHRASIQQLKQQDKIKQQQYLSQYRSLQSIYNQKQVMFTNQLKSQHEKFLQVNKQNYDLNVKIQQLEHDVSLLNDQVVIQKHDNQQNMQLTNQLREEMKHQSQAFTKQYREYNQQIADLMAENNVMEAENISLKEEIQQLHRKLQIQTAYLRKQYEELMETKVKLYQDELQFLKKQRYADVQNFQKIKKEYELEMSALIERETKENEELQKMFRDQMELKNHEFLQMKESYRVMKQTYDDLQLRLEIAEDERDKLKKNPARRPNKSYDMEELEIQQIEQESDDDGSQQQEQQSESSQDKKRKNKKKKKTIKEKQTNNKNKNKSKKAQQQKKKKQLQKQKQKKQNTKIKQSKKKQPSSSQSELQQSQQQSFIQQVQLSEVASSQILANIDDEPVLKGKQKNLVKANEKQALSERSISKEYDIESISEYGKQKNVFLPDIISIPVPMDKPAYNNNNNNDRKQANGKLVQSLNEINRKQRNDTFEEDKSQNNQQLLKAQDEIKQLEKQIKKLKKQIKDHQRTQTIHLGQIEELEEEVKNLNAEIDNLVKKVSKKDPKLAKNITAEIEERRSQNSISNQSRSEMSFKMPPLPKKQVQNMRMENEYLKKTVEEKNRALANLENERNNLLVKLQNSSVPKSQNEKRQTVNSTTIFPPSSQYIMPQNNHSILSGSIIQQTLKKTIIQLESKLMTQRQKSQQSKLQLTKSEYQKQQTQKQVKKLKTRIEQIEEEIKRNQPTQSQKEMQKQLQDYGKQFLDMAKNINSAKIQKQAFEQELRLVKKRYGEIIRTSQQAQTKAANLQRQLQDLRRKQGKARRDMQEYQDELKKSKQLIKILQQEINQNNTYQSQNMYQRKKLTDQIMRLQNDLSNKQFQTTKLLKELQKLKHKIQQGDDMKVNKRNDLLAQKQRLQSLLIKSQKRVRQLQDNIKQMSQKIQILQRQSRRNLQQKKSTYSDKLRFYVQQISSIKQIVDEYEQENNRLKIQNSELFEHNQILKNSFEKLQGKYEQLMESEEELLKHLDGSDKEVDERGKEIMQLKIEIQAGNVMVGNLRKQLDTERIVSKKKSDKLAAYEEINEKYLYEIKTLKIKLSQFETNLNQNELLTENVQKNNQFIQQLENDFKALQQQHNIYINTYTYRKQDVEQAMRELKQHEQKIKEEQIAKVIEELDTTYSEKQISMEQEIIELFNQNAKLRLALNQKTQEIAQINLKLSQLQPFAQKLKLVQKQCQQYQRNTYQLSEQLKNTAQQLRRAQSKLNESIRAQQGKTTQNVILSKKLQDSQKRCKQLNESYLQLKKQERKLTDRVKLAQQQKRGQIQKLTQQKLHNQNKILALQLQVGRLKQFHDSASRQYTQKLRKLQQKIPQLTQTYKQHQQNIQSQYMKQAKKQQQQIQNLSEQLQKRMQRIEELNQALIMLQQENQDLVEELTSARTQLAEEGDIYGQNITVLRNQLKEAEEIYDQNIRNIEEEMSMLNKQLNMLKYNRSSTQSGGTHRLAHSLVQQHSKGRLNQSKAILSQQQLLRAQDNNTFHRQQNINILRYEQKLKVRDNRIQQLKSQLLLQQQRMSKLLKGKQSSQQSVSKMEMDRLKCIIQQKTKYFDQLQGNYRRELNVANEKVRLLTKQVSELRAHVQQQQIVIQSNNLQLQSYRVQLKTLKQLYNELQKQLQRRKSNINSTMKQQSQQQAENRINMVKIKSLEEKVQELVLCKNNIQGQLKRKSGELRGVMQERDQVVINYRELQGRDDKRVLEVKNIKQSLTKTQQLVEKLTLENKKLKNDLTLKQKQIKQTQGQLQINQLQINHLKQQQKNKHYLNSVNGDSKISSNFIYAKKYIQLDNIIRNEYNISLEEYCSAQHWNDKLNEKDHDIQLLGEQLQELRFLNDHQQLEINQLKKSLWEMQIKCEQTQMCERQLQQLRALCERLQEEKKDAVFKQQALKLQLQNLIQSEDRNDITMKLQDILQMSIDV